MIIEDNDVYEGEPSDEIKEMQEMARQKENSELLQSQIQQNTYEPENELDAAELRIFEANTVFDSTNKQRQFKGNKIQTAKYNAITFLPLNLFHQFSKATNCYFLVLTFMELIPQIAQPGGFVTMILPLAFVVGVSMLKDLFEDYQRQKADKQENFREVQYIPRGGNAFQTGKSLDVQVGCIVKVKQDDFFPCDLILLNSALPKGVCYVETKNLDGETNLKHKQANQFVLKKAADDKAIVREFSGAFIECETPNEYIYNFDGRMRFGTSEKKQVPLNPDQILLRGSQLRNTEWIIGITVFTGHETKIMKNASSGRQKKSKIEFSTQIYVLIIVLIQFTLAVVAGFWDAIVQVKIQPCESGYLLIECGMNMWAQAGISASTWFLLLMNFVSISLLVSLETAKFFQGVFISWDYMIYDKEKDQGTAVQSSNLNEELGMVHYIFSDKTGTLTQNIMEFKKFSVGTYTYGSSNPKLAKYAPGVTNVNFDDDDFLSQLNNPSHPNHENILRYLECLGLCHTVIPEFKNDEQLGDYTIFNANSPDELALVNAARHFGFAFTERDENQCMVIQNRISGNIEKYELLNVIEFDSARKRMTVIVKTPDDKIMVICKGADSIIEKRLKQGVMYLEESQKFLEDYANEGLRTLLIAYKFVEEDVYAEWNTKFQKALLMTAGKEKAINECAELIEQDFELIGSTAIEDKLQDEVGQTIADLKAAGIQVWVLTGDKVETAINIGYSCQLLTNEMNMFILKENDHKKLNQELNDMISKQKVTFMARPNAVIIAGDTLAVIQNNENLSETFVDLCEKANVVLACRVSPKQKAEVVQLVIKRYPKKTSLAIGDGANDVNMINAAHIGIGIQGLEGAQAARSSDYAISQFKFLKNLLFCHGREAYRKNAYLIAYSFYKNVALVMPIFLFGFWQQFSGVLVYANSLQSYFNVVFTFLPIMWLCVFDWEFSKQTLLDNPRLYRIGMEDIFFDRTTFWRWFFYATWQGCVMFLLTLYTLDGYTDGLFQMGEYTAMGNVIFLALIIFVNIKILISAFQYTFWLFFWTLGCLGSFFPLYYLICEFGNYPFNGNFQQMFATGQVWMLLIFFTISFVAVDQGMQMANAELRNYMLERNFKERQENISKMSEDVSVVTHKVASYKNRGFAYSGEAGNDVLVTDSMSNRLQDALRRQLFVTGMFRNTNMVQKRQSTKIPGLESIQSIRRKSNIVQPNNINNSMPQEPLIGLQQNRNSDYPEGSSQPIQSTLK